MAGYAALPTKNPGDPLTSALWNTYLQGNANSGFMRMIADTTLGGAAASIAFASIPATFAHLLLVGSARGDQAAATVGLNGRFNGDTGANYLTETLQGSGAAASAASTGATTSMAFAATIPAASAAASLFAPVVALIPNYASATPRKEGVSLAFYGGTPSVQLEGFDWSGTAAINSITILAGVGNLVAGTRFTLYGLPQ